MQSSETTDKIGAALVKALGELTNPPNSAVNPYFKSKYAPLPDILNHVRPVLKKNGLCVMQDASVTTRIFHSSGEWIESEKLFLVPQKDDPQGHGGAITYARRYQLASMLGISSEDDDDANYASQPSEKPQAQKPTGGSFLTEKQVKFLHVLCSKKSHDTDATVAAIKEQFGVDSFAKIPYGRGKELIDQMVAKPDVPAEDLDAPQDLPF